MAIGTVNTGGGGSGAKLTVKGVAGATVTASKDGKIYTRVFNSSGMAMFRGLRTGDWTITMSGDGQIATRTITITTDYTLTMSYFSATISITYPANSTCVVTDSSGVTVSSDSNTGDTAKTWTVTVGSPDTYTITATETSSSKMKSTTVTITTDGQSESVTLSYGLDIYNAGVFGVDDSGTQFTVGTRTDYNSITQASDHLHWWCDANTNNLFYVSPKISASGFSTLNIEIQSAVMNGPGQFGLAKGNTNSPNDYVAKTNFNSFRGAKTLSVDISKVKSTKYYIKLTQSGNTGADTTANITHIWLEE